MGEPCAHEGNDGLSAAGVVTWHRCNSDQRPLPSTDGVGVPVNPLSSVVYRGGAMHAQGGGASCGGGGGGVRPEPPFEHKSIPFTQDIYDPPRREMVEYNNTGHETVSLNRHGK